MPKRKRHTRRNRRGGFTPRIYRNMGGGFFRLPSLAELLGFKR